MSKPETLPHAFPHEMGISPKALLKLLDTIEEKKLALHGLILVRHGNIIAEGWWDPYGPNLTHMLFSLSKSFTSTAIGFAVQEGLLTIEDRVVDFFPEKLPGRPCENMEKLRIKHLLTMSTGHNTEPESFRSEDWVEEFLTSYIPTEPGSHFLYNTPATYLLSAILQKTSGLPVGEYLRPRLFEPLGISDWWWEKCPQGIHTGGFGLNLYTGDIARFGQFLLQKGAWNGRQLLDPEWIAASTSYQVKNFGERDWGSGYGYQFWQCVPEGGFRGDGAFGQLCVVLPEQDMVIATNAGLNDIQAELDVFWECLLPAIHEEPLPPDDAAQEELTRRLAALRIAPPEGMATCETAGLVSGAVYELSGGPIQEISFTFGEYPQITLRHAGGSATCGIGYGSWVTTSTRVPTEGCHSSHTLLYEQAACAGAWVGGVYYLSIIYNTTPFADTLVCSFDENAIIIDYRRDISLEGSLSARLIGRRIS